MTLEALLEKFDQLSALPDAVSRMRELVLQLAVRGRLVNQSDADGTADELIEEISRRSRSVDGADRPAYKPSEVPLKSIPHNWCWAPTSALCVLETGKRMKGGAQDKGVISLGGEHLKLDGSVDYDVPRYISAEFYNDMRNGHVAIEDTLMVKDGATTGKVAFVKTCQ